MNYLRSLGSTCLQETLQTVTEQTFEALAFLSPGEPTDQTAETQVWAQVGFQGPVAGRLSLSLPQAMLATLTANMLGLAEEAVTEAQQSDALGEALNVICGNLLPNICGRSAVFRVEAPQVRVQQPEGKPLTDVVLDFDEGTARVCLHLHEDVQT